MTESSFASAADKQGGGEGEEPSDDVLLAQIADESDESARRAAWGAFYERHAEYLYGVCMRAYRSLLGEQGVEDLHSEVFIKVYERGAATYRPTDEDDEEIRRQSVRAWLATIATNRFRDILRGRKRSPIAELGPEEWPSLPETDNGPPSPALQELCRVMDEVLDERERDVLRVTFHWHDVTREHQKLPEEAIDELARLWALKPDNIRQIRRRALQKLKAALPPGMWLQGNGR